MKNRRNILIGVGLLMIIGVIVGCSAPAPAATQPAEESAFDDMEEPEAEETEAPAEEEFESAEEPAEPGGEVRSDDGSEVLVESQPQERMIIKNGEMSLVVEDTDIAVNRVTQIATDNGGYVLSSQSWYSGEFKNATVTIAVRSDRFETALERLRGLAIQVLSETSSGEDVTSEFVDLNSRLGNLEATRDRIQTFLDDAKNVEEALKINQQLSDIDDQIEQVKGRMKYLSGRAAFSTITVQIEVPQPTPTPSPTPKPTATPTPWSPGATLKQATKTQTHLFQGLVEAMIWLVVVPGPYLLAIGLVVAGARWYVVRNGRSNGGTKP